MVEPNKCYEVTFKGSDASSTQQWYVEADGFSLTSSGDLQLTKGNEVVAAFRSWCGVRLVDDSHKQGR